MTRKTYTARGSEGEFTFDADTGEVLTRANGGYPEIVRVDVTTLDHAEGPDFDVLEVPYISAKGEYVRADAGFMQWRAENAVAEKSPKAALLTHRARVAHLLRVCSGIPNDALFAMGDGALYLLWDEWERPEEEEANDEDEEA